MKPNDTKLNDFEKAIFEHIAKYEPSINHLIHNLNVLSREFTGVGSFTNLYSEIEEPLLGNKRIGIKGQIKVPNVPSGLDAIIFCENGKIKVLEICTFGSEHWNGNYIGFIIENN